MEERKLKVIFCKDGRGATNTKITLPISWLKLMGVSQEDREVNLKYDEKDKRIIIEKK